MGVVAPDMSNAGATRTDGVDRWRRVRHCRQCERRSHNLMDDC